MKSCTRRMALLSAIAAVVLSCAVVPAAAAREDAGVKRADPGVLTMVGKDGTQKTFTMAQLKSQFTPFVGYTGFQNSANNQSGPYGIKGVALADLLKEVGYDNTTDLIVRASDGYQMLLSSKAVTDPWWFYAWYRKGSTAVFKPEQTASSAVTWAAGEPQTILAYEQNNKPYGDPDYEHGWFDIGINGGPLRLWVAYTGWRDPALLIDGHWSVQYVDRVSVQRTAVKQWSIKLNGPNKKIRLTRNDFTSCYNCHKRTIKVGKNRYQGIPLYYLIGKFDDNKWNNNWGDFNARKARKGYRIEFASSKKKRIISSKLIADRTKSIIVAWSKNGKELKGAYMPLWLQGKKVKSTQRIYGIKSITLRGVPRR